HEREAGALILSLLGREEAVALLRALLPTEKNDDVRDIAVAHQYGAPAAIDRKQVAARVASAEARGKPARPAAKWIDERHLPALRLTGGAALGPDTVRFLLHRQTRQSEIAPDPEVRDVYPLIDRAKSGDFAEELLGLVLKNGGPAAKNRF